MSILTPEQRQFLNTNPGIKSTFANLIHDQGLETAKRYLLTSMGAVLEAARPKTSHVRRGMAQSEVQARIVAALRDGPKTRDDFLALGLSPGAIDRNLPELQRQRQIIGTRKGRNTQAVYRLTQEGRQ